MRVAHARFWPLSVLVLTSCAAQAPSATPEPVELRDECSDGSHTCAAHAACFDTVDSFRCVCTDGYEGDGVTCSDIDECADNPCGAQATCANDDGGFSCVCAPGWRLVEATNACEPDCLLYTEGHGDMFAPVDDEGGLQLRLRTALGADTEALHDPATICIVVDGSSHALMEAAGGRPAGVAFDGIGVAAGEPYWFLSQTPLDDEPWFGLSTEGVAPGTTADGTVRWQVSVQGPGDVAAFFDPDGNGTTLQYLFSSTLGLEAFVRNESIHEHMSWSFTDAGDYRVHVSVDSTRADDGRAIAAAATFRFVVLP
jgi:surface-anchored protein